MLEQVAAAATSVSKVISEPKTAIRSTVSTVAYINIMARVIPGIPYGTYRGEYRGIRRGNSLGKMAYAIIFDDKSDLCTDFNVKRLRGSGGTRSTATDGWWSR